MLQTSTAGFGMFGKWRKILHLDLEDSFISLKLYYPFLGFFREGISAYQVWEHLL